MIKTPSNSCWLWSSFRVAKSYCDKHDKPKDLHSELLIKYINNEVIDIANYNESTIKEGDVDNANCGNAVEYLTLNGIFYDNSLVITPKVIPNGGVIVNLPIVNYDTIYAILVQFIGHFQAIIKEDNEYYLYDQSHNEGTKRKLNIVNNQLLVPVMRHFTILYFYKTNDVEHDS